MVDGAQGQLHAQLAALGGFARQVRAAVDEVSGGVDSFARPEATRVPVVDSAMADLVRAVMSELALSAEVLRTVASTVDGAAAAYAATDREAADEVPDRVGGR